MVVPTSRNLSSFLPYGITNLHGVSSTMSSTGCLAIAIEPTLLGVGMAPIWSSIKFGGTCPELPYTRFSALGPIEAVVVVVV
jgi:hypothetical protein